jgi:hypothetical protein
MSMLYARYVKRSEDMSMREQEKPLVMQKREPMIYDYGVTVNLRTRRLVVCGHERFAEQ